MLNPSGMCECGCGQPAPLAKRNIRLLGHIQGEPVRFIAGHTLGIADAMAMTPTERFWMLVDRRGDDECWPWKGRMHLGYGWLSWNGRPEAAHRIVYEFAHGAMPPAGLVIDHLCRNRACVNPSHFDVVTSGENVLRGESPAARNARKTHCLRGHEFTPENTHIKRDGRRNCRACARERYHEKQARPT